jgi:two-component system NtrC family sensor kinase
MIFIAAASFLAALMLTFLLASAIMRPLTRLVAAIGEIGRGNLGAKVDISSRDEIGQVGRAFNRMAEDLHLAWQKIAEQNRTLEQRVRERTQELEQAHTRLLNTEKMAAVGQLAGGVAHEINNPLGVILGFAQGVARRVKDGDPLAMPLRTIEREATRCKNLVQDLLTFSRSGKSEKEKCDLNQVIEDALHLVEAQTKVKSVQLVKELGRDIPPVLVNRNQIQQVVINLCNNAVDAMPEGGTLTVRTRKSEGQEANPVLLEVSDTGTGIPKEIQSKIFEPFFTTKEVGKGTGLGLSLVYEIVKKHDGTIEIESELGQGTKFIIGLPPGE